MRVVIIDNFQSYFIKTLNFQNKEWSNGSKNIEVTNLLSRLALETLAFILIIFYLFFISIHLPMKKPCHLPHFIL